MNLIYPVKIHACLFPLTGRAIYPKRIVNAGNETVESIIYARNGERIQIGSNLNQYSRYISITVGEFDNKTAKIKLSKPEGVILKYYKDAS